MALFSLFCSPVVETLTLPAEHSVIAVALQEVGVGLHCEELFHYTLLTLFIQVTLLHAPRVCEVGGAVVLLVGEEGEGSVVGLVVEEEDMAVEEASEDVGDVVVGEEGLIGSGLSLSTCFGSSTNDGSFVLQARSEGPQGSALLKWNGLAHLLAYCTMHLYFVHFRPLWSSLDSLLSLLGPDCTLKYCTEHKA